MNFTKEIGDLTKRIAVKLSRNEQLSRLLKYTYKDPLSEKYPDWDVVENNLLNKNIRIVPKINQQEDKECFIVIYIPHTDINKNRKFVNLLITIDIFCNLEDWLINDDNIRPMAIIDHIVEALDGKNFSSIGTLELESVDLDIVTDNISKHTLTFTANGSR